jgi:hypothetical protein
MQIAMTHAQRTWTIAILAGAAIIAGLGLALGGLIFTTADSRRAIALSAVVAYVVQTAGFAVVRRFRSRNLMGAWGLTAGLRFVALLAYAFLVVKVLGLPGTAALFSLVTFFFVTTLAEPWLLRT